MEFQKEWMSDEAPGPRGARRIVAGGAWSCHRAGTTVPQSHKVHTVGCTTVRPYRAHTLGRMIARSSPSFS